MEDQNLDEFKSKISAESVGYALRISDVEKQLEVAKFERDTLAETISKCLPDLEHYVATHGAGPDVRLANLRKALAILKDPK